MCQRSGSGIIPAGAVARIAYSKRLAGSLLISLAAPDDDITAI
jgi:hypothetical protein